MEKLEWLGYNLVSHIMIDSFAWAQCINVTDTQTDRQTDSHVAIANAAPMHCVGRQKNEIVLLRQSKDGDSQSSRMKKGVM